MKILMLVSGDMTGDVVRGGEKHALEVARRLRNRGHDVRFLCRSASSPDKRSSRIDNFDVDYIPPAKKKRLFWRLGVALLVPYYAREIKKRPFPDAVISFTPWLTVASSWAYKRKVKIVNIVADLLVASHQFEKKAKVKFNFSIWFKNGGNSFIEYLSFLLAKKSIVSSRWMRDSLVMACIPQAKLLVAYPGPSISKENLSHVELPSNADFFAKNCFTILFVGALTRRKNAEILIHALSFLDDEFCVIFAGTGPLEKELKELAIEKKVYNRVVFLGWVNTVDSLYSKCDVLCHCATYETYGMIYPEAGRFGCPVIAPLHIPPYVYSVGPELIGYVFDGLLYDPRSPEHLSDTIKKIAARKDKRTSRGNFAGRLWGNYVNIVDSLL